MLLENVPFLTAKGVTLTREDSGENMLWTTLFLENIGITNLSSKNFMGDSEPLVWGYFSLRKKSRSRFYFVDDIDVKDVMFHMRKSRDTLFTAVGWIRLLLKYVPREEPDDELLNTLYVNMKLLDIRTVPADVVNWRFLQMWLEEWGLAPDIGDFYSAKGFNAEEIKLLYQVRTLIPKEVTELFAGKIDPNVRENVFKIASDLAVKFLDEK